MASGTKFKSLQPLVFQAYPYQRESEARRRVVRGFAIRKTTVFPRALAARVIVSNETAVFRESSKRSS
jgi:hypothetical protein